MKTSFFFLSFLTLILSCSDRVDSNFEELSLKGLRVHVDAANKKIWPKVLCGDVLYSWDTDYYCGTLSKAGWQKSDSLFIVGNGHNEFGAMSLAQCNDGSLFILNRPFKGDKLTSLTRVQHADSLEFVHDNANWERYDLKQLTPLYNSGENFVALSDSTILVAGAPIKDCDHIFSIIDFKKQKIFPLEYWPDDGVKCDIIPKHRFYTSHCRIYGDGNGKFLYKNEFTKLAYIFSVDGKKVNILKKIYSELLDYGQDKSSKDFFIENPSINRLACCVDRNRIYFLIRDSDCRGEKLTKFKSPFIFGNTVEVYDWDGVKKQVIHLDNYGQDIMIPGSGKTLYLFPGYSEKDIEPTIYSYDLNDVKFECQGK